MCVPRGLHAYYYRPLQPFVENPCFLGMQQPALDQLARFHVQHCYLLEARMKVTAYILHMRPPSSRALRSLANRVYSRLLGAVVVIQSSRLPAGRVKTRNDYACVAPALLPVLGSPRRAHGHRQERVQEYLCHANASASGKPKERHRGRRCSNSGDLAIPSNAPAGVGCQWRNQCEGFKSSACSGKLSRCTWLDGRQCSSWLRKKRGRGRAPRRLPGCAT